MDAEAFKPIGSVDELANAIDSANKSETGASVHLFADVSLAESLLEIEDDLTIAGNGRTIDGNDMSTTFEVGEGGSLSGCVLRKSVPTERFGGLHAMDERYSQGIGLRNSILAGNQGGEYVGRLDDSVGNLLGDGSCAHAIGGDPMLGELVELEYGSPAIYPPLPGSPAIRAALRHFYMDRDQLETYRPYKSYTGAIGAIEYVFDS
jgi:hypothetical protein